MKKVMKKVYCSANSMYFFAFGVLYRIKGEERVGVFNSPIVYSSSEDIRELVSEHGIRLNGTTEISRLEELIKALKERQKSKEEVEGRFVAIERDNEKYGMLFLSGKITGFEERSVEYLKPFLREMNSRKE